MNNNLEKQTKNCPPGHVKHFMTDECIPIESVYSTDPLPVTQMPEDLVGLYEDFDYENFQKVQKNFSKENVSKIFLSYFQ